MLEVNKIYNACCIEKFKEIDDKSIDMVLCDFLNVYLIKEV